MEAGKRWKNAPLNFIHTLGWKIQQKVQQKDQQKLRDSIICWLSPPLSSYHQEQPQILSAPEQISPDQVHVRRAVPRGHEAR